MYDIIAAIGLIFWTLNGFIIFCALVVMMISLSSGWRY